MVRKMELSNRSKDVQSTSMRRLRLPWYKNPRSFIRSSKLVELIFVVILQDPRVVDAMLPYMLSLYGNAHSRTHPYGWESEQAVEEARKVDF